MFVGASDGDVSQSALIAQRDRAVGVDAIVLHPVMHRRGRSERSRFEPRTPCDQRCASTQCAVRTVLVVVGAEGIELEMLVGVALVAVLSLTVGPCLPPRFVASRPLVSSRSVYARDSAGRRGKVRREAHRVGRHSSSYNSPPRQLPAEGF